MNCNLQTIADACGVSKSSVSLALKNDSRLTKSTRDQVQRTAERLGYRKDPVLADAMSNLRRGDGCLRGTIAGVDLPPALAAGIRDRLATAKYKLECFVSDRFTEERLTQVIHAKGIVGVVSFGCSFGLGKGVVVAWSCTPICSCPKTTGEIIADLLMVQLAGEAYAVAPVVGIQRCSDDRVAG